MHAHTGPAAQILRPSGAKAKDTVVAPTGCTSADRETPNLLSQPISDFSDAQEAGSCAGSSTRQRRKAKRRKAKAMTGAEAGTPLWPSWVPPRRLLLLRPGVWLLWWRTEPSLSPPPPSASPCLPNGGRAISKDGSVPEVLVWQSLRKCTRTHAAATGRQRGGAATRA